MTKKRWSTPYGKMVGSSTPPALNRAFRRRACLKLTAPRLGGVDASPAGEPLTLMEPSRAQYSMTVPFCPKVDRAMLRRTLPVLLLLVPFIFSGCTSPSSESDTRSSSLTDQAFLRADLWNDGQAEVAFYEVERTRDQYGRESDQEFAVGTYLVKHQFSPDKMTKVTDGGGIPSFKYALFYEFESGSYEYKRNWVVNARQKDLRPYKQSFTSFDWCSNQYREMAFRPDGTVDALMRSDDYGNRRSSFSRQSSAYAPAQIPLLVRGLDFEAADTLAFTVQTAENRSVAATAVHAGSDSVRTPAGAYDAERIRVNYDEPVPSMIGEEADTQEVYWRGTGRQRLLVKVKAESGRYQMQLVEHVRSPYWEENLWPKLKRIQNRP